MFKGNLLHHSKSHPAAQNQLWQSFLQKDLPTRKQEDWKYTDISFLDKNNYAPDIFTQDVQVYAQSDGLFQLMRGPAPKNLPQIKGLKVLRKKDAIALLKKEASFVGASWTYDNYFEEMVHASASSELFFIFDKEWVYDDVLKLQYYAEQKEPSFTTLGVAIVVLPGASVQIHEMLQSSAHSVTNVASMYYVGENAQLTLFKLDQTQKGRVVSTTKGRVAKNGRFHSVHFTGDALWARHNAYVELVGEAAHAELSASYLGDTGHFVDHHTFLDHKVGYTTSNQEYSGVLAAKSTGVFNGKVWIQRDAQKSNAEQLSRNLLLSKSAEANSKPELLIDADDVKAKHGATIGQMDQEELFYMQSRGLTPVQAREMVLKSFVFASAEKLPDALKAVYYSKVTAEVRRFISELKDV